MQIVAEANGQLIRLIVEALLDQVPAVRVGIRVCNLEQAVERVR